MALKKFDEALTMFHKALTIDPKHFVGHIGRGSALFRLKRYPEALDCYEKAMAIAPDQVQGYNNRGLALAMLGRYDEAFASYDKALEIDPNFVEAYVNRGNVFGSLGRHRTRARRLSEGARDPARSRRSHVEREPGAADLGQVSGRAGRTTRYAGARKRPRGIGAISRSRCGWARKRSPDGRSCCTRSRGSAIRSSSSATPRRWPAAAPR